MTESGDSESYSEREYSDEEKSVDRLSLVEGEERERAIRIETTDKAPDWAQARTPKQNKAPKASTFSGATGLLLLLFLEEDETAVL